MMLHAKLLLIHHQSTLTSTLTQGCAFQSSFIALATFIGAYFFCTHNLHFSKCPHLPVNSTGAQLKEICCVAVQQNKQLHGCEQC